jgi:WhiB family redox-sensing transcriptional regulator
MDGVPTVTTLVGRAEKTRIPLPAAADLYAMMQGGQTSAQLAAIYGCSPTTITLTIRDSGVADPKPERIDIAAIAEERATAAWQADAACAGSDPSWWFPESGCGRNWWLTPESLMALQICNECPVRRECGDFADREREVGIWGGEFRKYRQ